LVGGRSIDLVSRRRHSVHQQLTGAAGARYVGITNINQVFVHSPDDTSVCLFFLSTIIITQFLIITLNFVCVKSKFLFSFAVTKKQLGG